MSMHWTTATVGLQAALFICAVGVPPKWAVDKFHNAGIPAARPYLGIREKDSSKDRE